MSESAAVAQFIHERQADVLARAIAAVEAAPDGELPGELHRLIGTLGTYQLTAQSQALRVAHDTLLDGAASPADVRSTAVAALRQAPTAAGRDLPC